MGSPVVVASPRKSPSYNRRANKPLVEKKRRARINGCLGQLKSLILGAMQTEGAQVSRLEKADILEMTVKYLQHIQHQQVAIEPEVVTKFSAGYTECASEVIRYIGAVNCVSPEVKANLENHLVERLRGSVPQFPVPHQAQPITSRQNSNQVSQLSHANSFTSLNKNLVPASGDIYMKPNTTTANKEGVLTYVNEIDIANKAAAEALKRPQRLSPLLSSTPSVSVTGIRQTAQAAPVSPKSVSPKIDIPGGEELFNELRARHESGMSQVLHPLPRLSRSQSTSPPHARHFDDNTRLPNVAYATGDRERYNSSEPAHYTHTMAYSHQVCPPTAYSHEVYISSSIDQQHVIHAIKSEGETYNSDYDRPLHIHIPDSPRIPTTPSPPFFPPGMSYHPNETNVSMSSSNNSEPSLEDSPPTILYGYSQRSLSPVYKTETEESSRFTQNNSNIQFSEYTHEPTQVTYKSTNSGYANDSPIVSAVPASPSPPMLTREEPFPTHISQSYRTGSHCQDNFGNEQLQSNISATQGQHCYIREPEQFAPAHTTENVFTEFQSDCCGRFYEEVQPRDQPDVRRQQQYCSEVTSGQHYSGNYQLSQACNLHVPAPNAEEHAKNQHNEQSVVNGPVPPQQSALSRQKDTPLSLKRRILDGLGSEGEWMPPGNKRSRQQEKTTYIPSKEKDFMAAGEVMCTVSAQCTADDSLWRPW